MSEVSSSPSTEIGGILGGDENLQVKWLKRSFCLHLDCMIPINEPKLGEVLDSNVPICVCLNFFHGTYVVNHFFYWLD